MTHDEVLTLLARREEAWRQRDSVALAADYTDDCVIDSPYGGRLEGRRAAEDVYAQFFRAFPDLKFNPLATVIDGDTVALLTTISGTHRGEFFQLPPTNRPFSINVAWFYTFAGDRIAFERRVYDFTGLLVKIGVLKAKPVV
jgi:steroid delta-isomerase-like uncharacterized protein